MSKLLELALDVFKHVSDRYLPFLSRFIRFGLEWKAFAFSMTAQYSRQFGWQAVIGVGLLASLYAVFQFTVRLAVPDAPKASHDVILKSRFSSPLPSPQIVIVDIDERTLALLSEKHGRWPWSREVLADGLQKLADAKAKSILFNVMLSDPDKGNPDADAAMEVTAQLIRPVAFPLIRLAPKNDAESQLKISQIPGTSKSSANAIEDKTLAAILPMFSSMHDRLGVANQATDSDGIMRKYPLRWAESGYFIPSLVGRTLENAEINFSQAPDSMALNWRNKRGKYSRISFGDLVQDQISEADRAKLNGAFIVLGASAPGIGQTKPTGVSSLEDDSEILATALDDALNDTHLRTMPNWLTLLINLVIIWGLVWITMTNVVSSAANKLFVLIQSGLGLITLISASYTNYLIDLSDSMSFGIALFGVIKLIQSLDDRWSRARPGFRRLKRKHGAAHLLIAGWIDGELSQTTVQHLQRSIEREVGMLQVVRIDDLFAGESFIKSQCAKFKCLLVHANDTQLDRVQQALTSQEFSSVVCKAHSLQTEWDTENKQLATEISPLILELSAQLMSEAWEKAQRQP